MVGVEVLGLNPDNGSHFDVLLGVPLLILALIAFLVYQRRQKRARRDAYEQRRRGFKEMIRESEPLRGQPTFASEEERRAAADSTETDFSSLYRRVAARAQETRTLDEWLIDHGAAPFDQEAEHANQ